MQKRSNFFSVFLLFLFLSIVILFFSQKGIFPGVNGFFEIVTVPLQKTTFDVFHIGIGKSPEDTLREENLKLHTALLKQKELEKENKALHDQFQITTPQPKQLVPAHIIGRSIGELILDKGTKEKVQVGQVVILKDNLVGIVVHASSYRSVVSTVTNTKTSFTAQAVKTAALGVVNGRGEDEIIFNNVVQSDKLEKDDLVTTRGDIDASGRGYPPGLVVGKIVSVNKRASSLFQQADLKSLIDFSKLTTVFVLVVE